MRHRTVPIVAAVLLVATTTATVLTLRSIWQSGFAAAQSVSVFQTAIRLFTIVIALALWQFTRTPLERITLACWVVAAGSSALHYAWGWHGTRLEMVRAVSHLFAYGLSTIVLASWFRMTRAATEKKPSLGPS